MESCGCEKKCFTQITDTILKHIQESFQKLVTHNEKYLYFSGLIYKENREKLNKCQSRAEFQFHVRVKGYHVQVCQKTFENVHGMNSSDVRKVLERLKNNIISLDPDDKFLEQVVEKSNSRNTNAKKEAEKHIKSMLMKADVKKRILKGNKPNFTLFYEDYKSMTETNKRMATIDFGQQSANDENDAFLDCNPVSSHTYVSLFREVYPRILEDLQKEQNVDTSTRKESLSFPPANGTSTNCRKKTDSKKLCVRKRQTSHDRPIQFPSAKRLLTSKSSDLVLKQRETQQLDQGNHTNVTAGDNNDSAIYVLPTPASTKILTNSNITNNIVEMVYYI